MNFTAFNKKIFDELVSIKISETAKSPVDKKAIKQRRAAFRSRRTNMPTRARMEGEAMAGKMVEEVLVLEGEMAELVVRLVGVKVPAPQLEAGILLSNPAVVELLDRQGRWRGGAWHSSLG